MKSQAWNLLLNKNETPSQLSFSGFAITFQSTYFMEQLWGAASEILSKLEISQKPKEKICR